MLILRREVGEKIVIGDGVNSPAIVITVVHIDRANIKLGFEAPRSVEIQREENVPPDDPRRDNLPRF